MGCLQCQQVKPIPTCTTELVIGEISGGSGQTVYIFVSNLTTGKEYRQSATTTANGRVTLTMGDPEQAFYNKHSNYEMWITLSGDTINERQTITIDGQTQDCVNVVFTDFYKTNGEKTDWSSHILELDV